MNERKTGSMMFEKPTRVTVDLRAAFDGFVAHELIKDLHDGEDICPVCHGLGVTVADNRYGLTDDPEHPRLSFPFLHQAIIPCQNCYNGVIRRCEFCGRQLRRGYRSCDCEEVKRRKRLQEHNKLISELADAEKCEPDALGTRFPAAFGGGYPYNDGCFQSWEDFFDSLEDEQITSDERPMYVWAAEAVEMALDATGIVESACEDLYDDAILDVGDKAIQEMQAYLDGWKEKYGVTAFSETHKYAIRIPWEITERAVPA